MALDILQLILNSHAISISEAPNLTSKFYAQLCGRSFFNLGNNRANFQSFKGKLKLIQDHELKGQGILLFQVFKVTFSYTSKIKILKLWLNT